MSEDLNTEESGQQEAVLLVFSNNKEPLALSSQRGLLKMVYHTVLTNRLGLMQALNTETGEEELVLVGIEQNGSGVNCYPLFKPITAEEAGKYAAPDGKGGWLTKTPEHTE